MDEQSKKLLAQWLVDVKALEQEYDYSHTENDREDCPTWRVWELIDDAVSFIEGIRQC